MGGTSLSYDTNGNLTGIGGYTYYFYDCENRLTDVNDQNGDPVASYAYDYLGRRIRKTVYGSPDVVTQYAYDGDQVIAEYDVSGTLLRKFVYGPGIDEPICLIDVADNNAVYYYHYDGLGSVIALSDVNNAVVERYRYDVFGEPNRTSDVNNPYLFTARRFDAETGLYYYRARYYAYDIGRFLQPDPIGCTDGLNLYSYCGNDPVNYSDPSGLFKEAACGFGRRSLRNAAVIVGTVVVVGAVAVACPAVGAALAKVAPYLLVAGGFLGGGMLGQAITGEDLRGNPLSPRERGELLSDAGFMIGGSFLGAAQMQAATPGNVARIHGNSLNYVGETHVYAIRGPNGTYKIGQSMQGVRVRDGASIRGEAQVRALRQQTGQAYRSEIQRIFPDKASAYDYETRLIQRFRSMFGDDALPGNRTNH